MGTGQEREIVCVRGEKCTVLYLHDVVEIYIIVACQGRFPEFHDNFHVAVFKIL